MNTILKEESIMNLSNEELQGFKDLALQFSKKSLLPMFEGEFSDGNLGMLPGIHDTAYVIGLASSPDLSMEGSEYGIWGKSTDSSGLISSIEILSIIAETCGGTAMSLNAQGVASNLLLCAGKELPFNHKIAALCFQEGFTPPYCGTIFSPHRDLPASITTTATSQKKGYELNGLKSFVYSMGDPDVYVILALIDEKWGCFAVPSSASGITKTDAGHRTGLRACSLNHINFDSVLLPPGARIDDGDALHMVIKAMCLNWIGMSSIAAGIATGAVKKAREYAANRYQGGCMIEEYAAVQILIADSEARADSAKSNVRELKNINLTSIDSLSACASAKLICMELCAKAVTDSLQVFGGYGYMEDFGMEKMLRDVTVLKSASGSTNYLKQLIFNLGRMEK